MGRVWPCRGRGPHGTQEEGDFGQSQVAQPHTQSTGRHPGLPATLGHGSLGFGHIAKFCPVFSPVWDLRSAQDRNGKQLKIWQGWQNGRGCLTSAKPPLGPTKYLGGFTRWDGLVERRSAPRPPARHAHALLAAEVAPEETWWCPLPWLPGANRHPPDSIDFPPKGRGENCLNYNSSTLHFSIIS